MNLKFKLWLIATKILTILSVSTLFSLTSTVVTTGIDHPLC